MTTVRGLTMLFRVERSDDVPLEFDGELLADLSSKDGQQPRWQEIRIYRIADDKGYVTEMVGVSSVPGERDFVTVKIHVAAADVRTGLYRKSGSRTFLPDLAFEALEIAAEADPAVSASLVERL